MALSSIASVAEGNISFVVQGVLCCISQGSDRKTETLLGVSNRKGFKIGNGCQKNWRLRGQEKGPPRSQVPTKGSCKTHRIFTTVWNINLSDLQRPLQNLYLKPMSSHPCSAGRALVSFQFSSVFYGSWGFFLQMQTSLEPWKPEDSGNVVSRLSSCKIQGIMYRRE